MSRLHIDKVKYNLFVNIIQKQAEKFIEMYQTESLTPSITLNGFDWTPLHTAAYSGDEQLINFLLAQGANPNITCKNGRTAHDMAKEKGHDHLLGLLTPHHLDDIIEHNQRYGDKIS